RRRAIEEFRSRTETLRSELRGAFETESNREIDRAVDNVQGALDPYTRFVRAERSKVEERAGVLADILKRLVVLRRDVERITA
ncbi:MAG TPA: hypothetical protein VKC34_13015, partial [Blastocatellia bacterium]|nr:hypothetical protein [Blastocatellia bacterium]